MKGHCSADQGLLSLLIHKRLLRVGEVGHIYGIIAVYVLNAHAEYQIGVADSHALGLFCGLIWLHSAGLQY